MLRVRYVLHEVGRVALFAVPLALIVGFVTYKAVNSQPRKYQATTSLYVQQLTTGGLDIPMAIQTAGEYAALINPYLVQPRIEQLMKTHYHYPHYHFNPSNFSLSIPRLANAPLLFVTMTDTKPYRAAAASEAAAEAVMERAQKIQLAAYKASVDSLNRQFLAANRTIFTTQNQINHFTGSPTALLVLTAELQAAKAKVQQLQSVQESLRTQRETGLDSVSVFEAAPVPASATSTHALLFGLLLGLLTLALVAGLVYGLKYFNGKPTSREDIEESAGAPVIGAVPDFRQKGLDSQLVTAALPQSPASEAYRVIRTNVQFAGIDRRATTLVITSPQAKEGKSVTASNLARSFADAGYEVTLVDTDLRHPSLQRIFHAEDGRGLSNLLLGEPLNGHARSPENADHLQLITSGPLPASPADVLGSSRMASLVVDLGHSASYVFLDAPPILGFSDAIQLSAMVDGVILVVDPHRSRVRDISNSREAIEAVGGKILGVVINGVRSGDAFYALAQYGYRS